MACYKEIQYNTWEKKKIQIKTESFIIISIGGHYFVSIFPPSSLLEDVHVFRDREWLSFFESMFRSMAWCS